MQQYAWFAPLAVFWMHWTPAMHVDVVVMGNRAQPKPLTGAGVTGYLRPTFLIESVRVPITNQTVRVEPLHAAAEGVNFELQGVTAVACVTDAVAFVRAVGTKEKQLQRRIHTALKTFLGRVAEINPSEVMLVNIANWSREATVAVRAELKPIGVDINAVHISRTFTSDGDIDEIHNRHQAAGAKVKAAHAERRAIAAEAENAQLEQRARVVADQILTNWTVDKMLMFARANATAAEMIANVSIAGERLAQRELFKGNPAAFAEWLRARALRNAGATYVLSV